MYTVDYEMGLYPMAVIRGYDGNYAVDTQGTVWSVRYNRPLKPSINKYNGYCRVNLTLDGKSTTYYVHRLVATYFLPAVVGLDEIDHIDTDKTNNKLDNLRWITHSDNCARNRGKMANCRAVRCIETGEVFGSVCEAARSVQRHESSMVSCLKGRSSSCAGLHWEYV